MISTNHLEVMSLKIHKNIPLVGKHQKAIVTDFIFPEEKSKLPIVIFCHGYKGYKDWGAWQLMLKQIAKSGCFVVAFNFSHNGGTIQNPIDFPDLEAFGNDNFSKQQDDLQSIIDEVTSKEFKFSNYTDITNVTLIGHSRGGGASIIKTTNEPKITRLVTLASICTYNTAFPEGEKLKEWKKKGVWYIKNGRTQQQMPHYIQFYEDYQKNKANLNIEIAAKNITVPHLLVHGTEDTSVSIGSANLIASWNPNAIKYFLKTNHVFHTQHPWEKQELSTELQSVTQKIIDFLKS